MTIAISSHAAGDLYALLSKADSMMTTVSFDQIKRIIDSEHYDPFQVLGAHEVQVDGKNAVAIRAFLPEAKEAFVLDLKDSQNGYPMNRVHPKGFFEATFPDKKEVFSYKLKVINSHGQEKIFLDPYSFLPILSDYDLYLFNEGSHHRIYEKLGTHILEVNGIKGVHFSVWAPNALRVSVVGNFNNWDGRTHQMRNLGNSGVWELFIPGLLEGGLYKFEIKAKDKQIHLKADPFKFASELRPKTAGIIYDINIDKYTWHDQQWIQERDASNRLESPVSIYEVHLGSWMRVKEENNRWLTYRELAHKLVEYVNNMGFTHIELLPIAAHPYDGSWGYQVSGYYAPTARYGNPEDFMYLVDCCHQNGVGLILDWVPSHFPKDSHALSWFDGSAIYEHVDPRMGEHKEWGTKVFNYGRNEVRSFMLSNAIFWTDKYHLDGLRVDAVASMLYLDYARHEGEWIPNKYGGKENLEAIDFLKKVNESVYKYHPGAMMIAEESTAWPGVSRPTYLGGLGFGFKWNMGWMHDTLEYMCKEPVFRKFHHSNLTFSLLYAFSENFILPLSHDEVVHGKRSLLDKMPGDIWQKFANLRLLLGFMYGHPGKKHLFMGGEFGQWIEWDYNRSLDWHLLEYDSHRKLQQFVRDLNRIYQSEPALYEVDFHYSGFEWIDFRDAEGSIISFMRKGKHPNDILIFVLNFTPVPRVRYKVGVPFLAFYREILNSDSEVYFGSNLGNGGGLRAENTPCHQWPYTLNLTLPPLSVLILKPEPM